MIPALNLDVVRNILLLLPSIDLWKVTYTSRLLRQMALEEALSRPVRLKSESQLKAFGEFMLAEHHVSLFPFLRQLDFEQIAFENVSLEDMVIEIIRRATRLSELQLSLCGWKFTTTPGFLDAVVALSNLRRLYWSTYDREADEAIARTVLSLPQNSLQMLEVPFASDNQLGETFPNALAERHPDLQELRIYYPTLDGTRWKPFAKIEVADLTTYDLHNVSLRTIVGIFPCLKELSLHTESYSVDILSSGTEGLQHRLDAEAFQRAGHGWMSLDYLSGQIAELYVLHVMCPVKHVHLGTYTAQHHDAAVDIISRTRPRRVSMLVWIDVDWRYPPEDSSKPLLLFEAEDGPGAVSHMLLWITCHGAPSFDGADTIVAVVAALLQPSRLHYLQIVVAPFNSRECKDEDSDLVLEPYSYPGEELAQILAGVHLPSLAARIAETVPSLHVLVLTIVTLCESVWVIDRNEDGPIVTRLDLDSGRILKERERHDGDDAVSSIC